jgi:hypothetical protein
MGVIPYPSVRGFCLWLLHLPITGLKVTAPEATTLLRGLQSGVSGLSEGPFTTFAFASPHIGSQGHHSRGRYSTPVYSKSLVLASRPGHPQFRITPGQHQTVSLVLSLDLPLPIGSSMGFHRKTTDYSTTWLSPEVGKLQIACVVQVMKGNKTRCLVSAKQIQSLKPQPLVSRLRCTAPFRTIKTIPYAQFNLE